MRFFKTVTLAAASVALAAGLVGAGASHAFAAPSAAAVQQVASMAPTVIDTPLLDASGNANVSAGSVYVSGTAEPNAVIYVVVDNEIMVETYDVSASGDFGFGTQRLSSGVHRVTLTVASPSGEVSDTTFTVSAR